MPFRLLPPRPTQDPVRPLQMLDNGSGHQIPFSIGQWSPRSSHLEGQGKAHVRSELPRKINGDGELPLFATGFGVLGLIVQAHWL